MREKKGVGSATYFSSGEVVLGAVKVRVLLVYNGGWVLISSRGMFYLPSQAINIHIHFCKVTQFTLKLLGLRYGTQSNSLQDLWTFCDHSDTRLSYHRDINTEPQVEERLVSLSSAMNFP